jgi:hypothetical protein
MSGCSITNRQKCGDVLPVHFDHKADFTTAKTVIVLPVMVNGVTKSFLFDTGAEFTLIQRDSVTGKLATVSGATNRTVKMGYDIVELLKIGDVDFRNTVALNANLKGLKEQIPNFGGLIGQPVISKANWLIDYPNQTIRFSDRNLADSSFVPVRVKYSDGSPYVTVRIDGEDYKAIIDLGSSAAFSVPEDSRLAKKLLQRYEFSDNQRDIYSVGGLQSVQEKVGVIPSIQLGDIEFKQVDTDIRYTSELRIGNRFFKDHILYIDNINRKIEIGRK